MCLFLLASSLENLEQLGAITISSGKTKKEVSIQNSRYEKFAGYEFYVQNNTRNPLCLHFVLLESILFFFITIKTQSTLLYAF